MTKTRPIPASGINLIKQFEGCKLTSYPDPFSGGAPWTIGWGTTKKENGSPFGPGETITQSQADFLLNRDLEVVYMAAISKIPYFNEMSDEQVGALLSFSYNLGAGFYGNDDFTTISRFLTNKDWERVPKALTLYCNPGTIVEEGLRRRREAEGKLWLSGLENFREGKRLIVAKQDTILKKEPVQSFELGPKERVEVQKGRSYTITHSVNDGVHTKVVLSGEGGTWFIYNPHWDIKVPGSVDEKKGKNVLLNVPYYTQLDSKTNHSVRMCFSSSCAMTAEYLKPGCLGGNKGADDLYLTKYVLKHGDTTNQVAQVRALNDLGIFATFRNNLTRQDVISQLEKNIPVPAGYLHKGPVNSPTGGGHWLVIVGIDLESGHYIVNDPWGDCDLVHGGMLGSMNGYRLKYGFKNFEKRWMVEGDKTGWGLIIVR